jgi:O-antigen/teichoic acid export membrane protein
MQIVKNYIFNFLIQATNLVAPLIITPYLIRVLGKNSWGEIAYVNIYTSYFIFISNFCMIIYGNKVMSASSNTKEESDLRFFRLATIQFLTSIFSILLYIYVTQNLLNHSVLFIFSFGIIIAAAFDYTWYFQSAGIYKTLAVLNLLLKLINIGFFLIFINGNLDVYKYFLILSISSLLGIFIYLKKAFQICKNLNFQISLKQLRLDFINLLPIFVPQLVMLLYSTVDRLILQSKLGIESLGEYDAVYRIILALCAGIVAFRPLLISNISNLHSQNNYRKIKINISKSLMMVSFISIPTSLALIATANILIPLYLGSSYENVVNLAMLLSLLVIFIGWGDVFANQVMLAMSMNREFLITILLMLMMIIILNILLVPIFGIYGVALATLTAHFIILWIEFYFVRNFIFLKVVRVEVFKISMAAISMMIFGHLLSFVVSKSLFGFLLLVLFCALINLFVLILLKSKIMFECMYYFKNFYLAWRIQA